MRVRYDNGEEDDVHTDHISPDDPPVEFGKEKTELQASIRLYQNPCTCKVGQCQHCTAWPLSFYGQILSPIGLAHCILSDKTPTVLFSLESSAKYTMAVLQILELGWDECPNWNPKFTLYVS